MTEISVRRPVDGMIPSTGRDGAGRDQEHLDPRAGQRLRPLKLATIAARLRPRGGFARALLSLQLLEEQFPEQIAWLLERTAVSAGTTWRVANQELWEWLDQTSCPEAVRFLILLILEPWFPGALRGYRLTPRALDSILPLLDHLFALLKDWFEVNDFLLESLPQWLQSEQDWPEVVELLVTEGPPVELLGFYEDELRADYAPVGLLRALLGDPAEINCSGSNFAPDFFPDWQGRLTETGKLAAWARLEDVEADPHRYPRQFHDLPVLARWACHRTGNPILDNINYCDECGHSYQLRWSDLAEIKTAWQQARPAREKLGRLAAWHAADPGCLSNIARFLMCKDLYSYRQTLLPGFVGVNA
jgi:hypothetical protein